MRRRETWLCLSILIAACMNIDSGRAQNKPKLSEASETCLSCHTNATPGIMADWGRESARQSDTGGRDQETESRKKDFKREGAGDPR